MDVFTKRKWSKFTRFIFSLLIFYISHSSYAKENGITFPDACSPGQSLTIAAVGDVLLHTPLQIKGQKQGFDSLWKEAIPYIQNADIAYANLEGPMARGIKHEGDNNVYSSFPYFNYPPTLALALKKSGFDIVSTANNHALDRYAIGIDKTIGSLNQAGMNYVGTHTRHSKQPWFHITTKNNFKIAWIACTETTNDNPDNYHQVLYCYKKKDRQEMMGMIKNLKHQVDAIIVTPHWGEEYHTKPNEEQIVLAHQILDAGATAIIGSHPHVLQPLQKYITKDGRATLIAYSLGNFVSGQNESTERSTVILLIGLTKKLDGVTIINGVRFIPMYMQNNSHLNEIHLSRPQENTTNLPFKKIISRVLPMQNAVYSESIITNPECNKSQ